MKKTFLFCMAMILSLSCFSCGSPKQDLICYPKTEWGMSADEVLSALHLKKEDVEFQTQDQQERFHLTVMRVNDQTLYGKTVSLTFHFLSQSGIQKDAISGDSLDFGLGEVTALFDKTVKPDEIVQELTKQYGDGVEDVVLTSKAVGFQKGSYADFPADAVKLLPQILECPYLDEKTLERTNWTDENWLQYQDEHPVSSAMLVYPPGVYSPDQLYLSLEGWHAAKIKQLKSK